MQVVEFLLGRLAGWCFLAVNLYYTHNPPQPHHEIKFWTIYPSENWSFWFMGSDTKIFPFLWVFSASLWQKDHKNVSLILNTESRICWGNDCGWVWRDWQWWVSCIRLIDSQTLAEKGPHKNVDAQQIKKLLTGSKFEGRMATRCLNTVDI